MQDKHINTVQSLKCKKCNFVAKDSNELKEHKGTTQNKSSLAKCKNGKDCSWAKRGRCRFAHEVAQNVEKVRECRHGEACEHKARGRYQFYHSDVGVQRVRQSKSRGVPHSSNEWHTVPSRWQHNQQERVLPEVWQHNQQQQFVSSSPNLQAQACCWHGASCSLGPYCELRHFSDQDVLHLRMQLNY